MSAPLFALSVVANTSYTLPIAWQVDGVPTSIQNNLFHAEVRDCKGIVMFVVDWQELAPTNYNQGLTMLIFTPAQTLTLKKSAYTYIVNMTEPSGFVRRILEGPVGVTQ